MKIRCNNCGWEGQEYDLALIEYDNNDPTQKHTAVEYASGRVRRYYPIPKDRNYFKGCPNCETDEHLMDL